MVRIGLGTNERFIFETNVHIETEGLRNIRRQVAAVEKFTYTGSTAIFLFSGARLTSRLTKIDYESFTNSRSQMTLAFNSAALVILRVNSETLASRR